MQNSSSKKTIIIVIILVILAGGAYFYFTGTPSDSSSLGTTSTPDTAASIAAGARVLTLLNQINSIQIDTKFFESSVYKSLVDNTVVVPEQNVGRANPFVPVPGTFVTPAPVTTPRR